ncbi:unnamed protein product [marine sediment metagenome]|uniref:Ribbon-helix-helix protein CopG domain-containing protein n=1 Tax=marine sediment metagenome TaxID=412755 RepID=X1IYX9_9ZZZZ
MSKRKEGMSKNRKRFSVTLTTAYVEAMEGLVDVGVYLDLQDVFRDALRQLFRSHRIEPFLQKVSNDASVG